MRQGPGQACLPQRPSLGLLPPQSPQPQSPQSPQPTRITIIEMVGVDCFRCMCMTTRTFFWTLCSKADGILPVLQSGILRQHKVFNHYHSRNITLTYIHTYIIISIILEIVLLVSSLHERRDDLTTTGGNRHER